MTYYEEIVSNAIQAARKTGYNQVVYRDGENSFAFSRDYPDNYMYSPEDVVGRVRIHWQKGVMKPKYVREPQRASMTAQELDTMVNAMRTKHHKVVRRVDVTDEIYYMEKGLRAIGMDNLANELQELYNQIDSIDTDEIVKLGTFNPPYDDMERD